jgi:methanogen extracellular protein (TIGR04279 family)
VHKNQAILNSIYQNLSSLVSSGDVKEVLKNTIQEPRDYPCIVIRLGDERVLSRQAFNVHDLELELAFDVVIKSSNKDVDIDLLSVCSELQTKITEDYKQGLGFVIDTTYQGRETGEYRGEAEEYYALASLTYNIIYRTDVNNPNV